jgi:hypothetical protein
MMQTWSITLHGPLGVISTVDTGESQFVVGTQTATDVFTVNCEGVTERHAWVWISEAGSPECRASGDFLVRSRNVRLIDETAFPFLDPNQSFGALQAKAKSKRADSRLRSLKPNVAGRATNSINLTVPRIPSTAS